MDQVNNIVIHAFRAYNMTPTPIQLNMWKNALKGYDIDEIEEAFSHHIRTIKRAPVPAAILEIIEGDPEEEARLAWSRVIEAIGRYGSYTTVNFEDTAIHAAIDDMGGWVGLCQTPEKDISFRAVEFRRLYVHHRKEGTECEWLPSGTTDKYVTLPAPGRRLRSGQTKELAG